MHLSIVIPTNIGKACPCRQILTSKNTSYNDIHKNKILAKIPGFTVLMLYSKTYVKNGRLKRDKTKILRTNDSTMQVKSIAECSPWSILQFIWLALSNIWSRKPILSLFESGRFTQVSLYLFQLIVTVQDVNDNPPAFNSSVYNLTMLEESSIGTFVGLVTATDPDKDPKV